MKKTKSNITKAILIILTTIVVLFITVFIIHITKNIIILNHLSNLLNSNLNTNNYHYEEYIKYKNINLIKEQYKKNNKYIEYTYVYNKADVHSIIQYSDGKEVIVMEENELKTHEKNANFEKYEKRTIEEVIKLNSSYVNNLNLEKIVNSRIYLDKNYNAYILRYGSVNIWFDAETGLPIRNVFGEQVHMYTFEFNNVTDEDVARPNITTTEAQ